jgi:hypothetical protein
MTRRQHRLLIAAIDGFIIIVAGVALLAVMLALAGVLR